MPINPKHRLAVMGLLLLLGLVLLWFNPNSGPAPHEHHRHPAPSVPKHLPGAPKTYNTRAIFIVDYVLRQLAATSPNHTPFIHPKAHTQQRLPYGPKMNSIHDIASITEDPIIDIPNPCGGHGGRDQILVVFIVCTTADTSKRKVIRQTYGSQLKRDNRTEVYFVIAKSSNESFEAELQTESTVHQDILQLPFIDDYFNLTIKSLAILRWTALHCPHVKFILKLDTDAFLRFHPLLTELQVLPDNAIYGLIRYNFVVHNDWSERDTFKWYIDELYWPYEEYPTYQGAMYFVPGSLTRILYQSIISKPTVDTIPALPFEDVYVTGILAEKAGITRSPMTGMINLYGRAAHLNLTELAEYSVHIQDLGEAEIRQLWEVFGVN